MLVRNWGYGETWGTGTTERRDARWVAYCNKGTFLRTIEEFYGGRGTRYWVEARMCATGNDFEIELIKAHPNKMVAYDNRTHEILKVLSLITRKEV